MKKYKLSILVLCSGLLILLALNSSNYTEQSIQIKKLGERYQIYPVPIPADLKFAGELVPLNSFDVKERLDRELLVNTYWQSNSMLILKRTKKYFAIIEPILERNGIPNDFKYMAVAESGLQHATSSAGAKGIWQFMDRSGKYYGLHINGDIDERYHLVKSTEAACRYLNEAYKKFGNWTLAAASYNRGITGINNALRNQKVSEYYQLHLNSETSRYIPRILAFKSIIEHPENYGFYLEPKDYYAGSKTTSITVETSILDLADFAKEYESNYHQIKTLNPWILGNSVKIQEEKIEILVPSQISH